MGTPGMENGAMSFIWEYGNLWYGEWGNVIPLGIWEPLVWRMGQCHSFGNMGTSGIENGAMSFLWEYGNSWYGEWGNVIHLGIWEPLVWRMGQCNSFGNLRMAAALFHSDNIS
eukprot:TRINITY_DN29629_c0_g1_i2.p1 TRINITY_DN29629_c0_g1~~TRINITY_DN29629_c0_g1_i2.p1  ORF type:complete len:123 (+),score=1.22 TRINITY_DN29629_c0_g1_i2:32-370(+)